MKRLLYCLFAELFILTLTPVTAQAKSTPSGTTTVILVRHAERDEGENPPLNQKGQERAEALATALEESGLAAIYVPDLLRNMQTARPVSERLGIPVTVLPEKLTDDPEGTADYVIKEIFSKHQGEVILFVGNQSTNQMREMGSLQQMYMSLGGKEVPLTRYTDMYIFTFTDKEHFHIIRAEFGTGS